MDSYDVIVVGAATAGSWLAHGIAERGHSVLVIEAQPREKVGTRYDIFHIAEKDFARFELPLPEEGKDKAFEFSSSLSFSAYGRYPKNNSHVVIGMHMHEYMLRLNDWAKQAGAHIEYDAVFEDFIYDDGKICGVKYHKNGKTLEARAGLVADCSGIPSCARRKLPEGYGVENFEITPEEMFYVVLRYVKYHNPEDFITGSRGWTFFKAWEAPSGDSEGAILGIGANGGFDSCEKYFAEFCKQVELPEHEVEHIERGTTPYRRPPYSCVADGFIACGDAACMTKPSAGEGVTSAMVQMEIACEVINKLIEDGKPCDTKGLWSINKRYNDTQGKVFAGQLAMLADAVGTTARENDFFFENDIVFSKKSFEALAQGVQLEFSGAEMISMALKMIKGVLTGRLRVSTISSLLRGMKNSDRMTAHYAEYPLRPEGLEEWVQKAEALWANCADMSDSSK